MWQHMFSMPVVRTVWRCELDSTTTITYTTTTKTTRRDILHFT
jgi:hypothetical protein